MHRVITYVEFNLSMSSETDEESLSGPLRVKLERVMRMTIMLQILKKVIREINVKMPNQNESLNVDAKL